MGAFSSRPSVTIQGEPGWEDGEYIKIKGVMTAGDMEQVAQQHITKGKDGEAEATVSTSQVAMLECMIEDWMLFGDGGKQVPLYLDDRRRTKNSKAIARLPLEYTVPVLSAIDKLNQKEAVPNPDDFFGSANEPAQES